MYISNFPYYNRRVLPLFNGASDCIPKGRHVHLKKPRTFFFVFYRNLVFWKSKKKKKPSLKHWSAAFHLKQKLFLTLVNICFPQHIINLRCQGHFVVNWPLFLGRGHGYFHVLHRLLSSMAEMQTIYSSTYCSL